MCGICGKAAFDATGTDDSSVVRRMMELLRHRGPDDDGLYVGEQVALGHRRLSIIDLSTGKQPISNEDRTIWIVYNGEIYNFKELRQELLGRGHQFQTQTDTEVIVHLYEDYGEGCLSKLRGMFAFALWDAGERKLLLARDRVGIKPLYYSLTRDGLVFASEMKALLADPSVSREVNPQVIDRFLTFLYVPGRETLIRSIQKLEPGHYLVLQKGRVSVKRYWDLQFSAPAKNGNFHATMTDLVDLLRETVRDHLISDVPVGILLSGGVDSTAMLSFAVEQAGQGVSTFTVGFDNQKFADERVFARLAAERLGSKHYEMTITARDFLDFLPKYVWHMEEPVCEPPAVALYYVTKMARQYVKVLISGEGGDEAFAGYQNYRNLVWLERFKAVSGSWIPAAVEVLGRLSRSSAPGRFEKYSLMARTPLERYYYSRTSGPFSFFNRTRGELYSESFRKKVDSNSSTELVRALFAKVAGQNTLNQMLYVDTKTWLPDDLLIKADRITMANSLELRVPLLDHKVLEFAASLPPSYKVRGFTTKYILKKAFNGRVPKEILGRRKTGFPVPFESWLKNELKAFVWEVLMDPKTLGRGYFNREVIEALLKNTTQQVSCAPEIFSLVILELWHRYFLEASK